MTTRIVLLVLSVVLFLACGGDDDVPTTTRANPCATPGATYLLRATEQPNGSCGDIPDQIVNVGDDGTISTAGVSCRDSTQDGCTARNTDCSVSVSGITCVSSSSVTFAADGASASGLFSQRCTGAGFACVSTYDIVSTRR